MGKPFEEGFVLIGVAILVFVFLLAATSIKQNPKESLKKSYSNTYLLNPEIKLELAGDLVPIDEKFFFHIKNDIKKIDNEENIVWKKDLNGFEVIGSKGKLLLLYRDGILKIIDDMGNEVLKKHDFLYKPVIKSTSEEVFLLTGEKNKRKFLTLIDGAGNIRLNKEIENPIILASTDAKGNYIVAGVLKDGISGEIVFLDSSGRELWKKKSEIPFLIKIINKNIIAVYSRAVCKLDFRGNLIWKKVFKNPVLKASIGNKGDIALVVEDTTSNFSRQVMPKLIALNSRGKIILSCFLQKEPYNIKVSENKLLAFYSNCIEIYPKGEDKCIVLSVRGKKDLKEVTSSYMVVKQGNRSIIIKDPGRM